MANAGLRPMGLLKWFARRGSVGVTARWSADAYLTLRGQHRNRGVTNKVLFRLLVTSRFKTHPDEAGERLLLSFVDDVVGLRGVVAAILTYEAGFTKRSSAVRKLHMAVIDEELQEKGIPRDVIFGRG
jgi:hypothetical protein